MPLHHTSQFLVDAIEAMPLLDGRFEGMALVNFDAAADVKRGAFSLVFRAHDRATDSQVALKFFDPARVLETYRVLAFRREHQILEGLLGVPGCLQLAAGLTTYQLPVPTAMGSTVDIPCEYFAVEWLDEEIDGYFLMQQDFSAAEKLALFGQVVRAVAILHTRDVFHRDLKPDNMRLQRHASQTSVVAIDLGTAALYSSTPMSSYQHQVGAYGYAAPEALCGLAGNRSLAPKTDIYALGCMLFELFNKDFFFNTLVSRNPNYLVVLTAMQTYITGGASDAQQEQEWRNALAALGKSFVPVPVNGAGSDIPPGIAPLINEIAFTLTSLDYRRRPQFSWVHARLRSAIRLLSHEKAYRKRLEHQKDVRANREMKVKRREARLERVLADQRLKRIRHGNK